MPASRDFAASQVYLRITFQKVTFYAEHKSIPLPSNCLKKPSEAEVMSTFPTISTDRSINLK